VGQFKPPNWANSKYRNQLVQVTGFVSHDFEDFTLFDPACPSSRPTMWLEYGGTSKSGTMDCCGVNADRERPRELVVESIPIGLTTDGQYQEFGRLIQPPFRSGNHGSVVHASLIGRFFSGRQIHYPTITLWGGYGHLGCCSLLAIEQIKSVDPQDRDDLDYGASPDQPDVDKTGCGYRLLTPFRTTGDLVRAQRDADLGWTDYAFNDPLRVATDALGLYVHELARHLHTDQSLTGKLELKRKAQGRLVYEWRLDNKAEVYLVEVRRPYWLSFSARDPKRVAWVADAVYVSTCGKN
jgi:hypothetical protein